MPQYTQYIQVVNRDDRRRPAPAAASSSQSIVQQTMTLGCEVETNLRAKSSGDDISRFGDANDRAAIAQFASRVCTYFDNYMESHRKAGRMRVKGDPRYGSGYSIALWTIERDGSIRKDSARQVSMEIVSPIMVYDTTELWRDSVKSMYKSVGDRYSFEANESCGLHVHLKPSVCWNMKDLRALSKAIVYFEPCLQALLPSHRASRNFYCKQNYSENPYLTSQDIGRCFETINNMSGISDLKNVMNYDRENGQTRYYAWNFTNLQWDAQRQEVNGTVEYRNPPFANSASTCLAWMELALTFASAARKVSVRGAKIRQKFSRDLPGLKEFLEYGAVQWTHKSDYESLFPRRRR
ncbi:hypothetical protein J7T55_004448 [Diaporthe amygdali]|uniref:uncharacterized protein n=1 Tax=Phomopsis amygdali TaxID=1214568 RepID=UPI0022FEEB0C|nr:uncharacterized protein J7T55_004448 [Diaporthe amygdali]KAJ0109898.1 hypothetical protein J7T55_004448 [Diaporthe amygdali]